MTYLFFPYFNLYGKKNPTELTCKMCLYFTRAFNVESIAKLQQEQSEILSVSSRPLPPSWPRSYVSALCVCASKGKYANKIIQRSPSTNAFPSPSPTLFIQPHSYSVGPFLNLSPSLSRVRIPDGARPLKMRWRQLNCRLTSRSKTALTTHIIYTPRSRMSVHSHIFSSYLHMYLRSQ